MIVNKPERTVLFLLSILAISICFSAYGTPQIPDELTVDGKVVSIHQSPLPPDVISEINQDHVAQCSANWRGYRAFWTLVDDKLLLDKIEIKPCRNPETIAADSVCTDCSYPIESYWYNGVLTYETGEWWGNKVRLNNGGYAIEDYRFEVMVIEISGGLVTRKYKQVQTYEK